MKICVVQTKPITGHIQLNIENHKQFIDLAVSNKASMIIFPELSLTGYEPKLAKDLATDQDDARFDVFQEISNQKNLTIGVGIPTKNSKGICISMILFQPHKERETHSKKYIHPDEEQFFVRGFNVTGMIGRNPNIALAICYELSVPQHSKDAFNNGAEIYLASVAKTTNGVENAFQSLAEIASKYSIPVLMSNCVGNCDGEICCGKSAVWNSAGILLAQLDNKNEGIIVLDTETGEISVQTR
jgi:predicted amidohydrolase